MKFMLENWIAAKDILKVKPANDNVTTNLE